MENSNEKYLDIHDWLITEQIKNEKGETVIEIPLTLGAIGALLVPTLAAVGAIAALVTKCSIIVEKK